MAFQVRLFHLLSNADSKLTAVANNHDGKKSKFRVSGLT
jgi:hypothetical protein